MLFFFFWLMIISMFTAYNARVVLKYSIRRWKSECVQLRSWAVVRAFMFCILWNLDTMSWKLFVKKTRKRFIYLSAENPFLSRVVTFPTSRPGVRWLSLIHCTRYIYYLVTCLFEEGRGVQVKSLCSFNDQAIDLKSYCVNIYIYTLLKTNTLLWFSI